MSHSKETAVGIDGTAIRNEARQARALVHNSFELEDYSVAAEDEIVDTHPLHYALIRFSQERIPHEYQPHFRAGAAFGYNSLPEEQKSEPVTPKLMQYVKETIANNTKEVRGQQCADLTWFDEILSQHEVAIEDFLEKEKPFPMSPSQVAGFNLGFKIGIMPFCIRATQNS